MAFKLEWDKSGEREFEIGVTRGVLYPMSGTTYGAGVVWNGLTSIEESPDGGEKQDIWADNIKYATFRTPENYKGTIKAYMFPDEFMACNGMVEPSDAAGMTFGQQTRKNFGLCYRTEIGDDTNSEKGYKLHIVYNCSVSPSSRSHSTKNENPDAEEMSWEFASTPINVTGVTGVTQVCSIEINSVTVGSTKMAQIEALLYGASGSGSSATAAALPTPEAIYAIIKAA